MKTYQLEVTENQLIALRKATELYARMGMGQFDYVAGELCEMFPSVDRRHACAVFDSLKSSLLGWEYGRAYGVHHPDLAKYAKIASDIMATINHQFALETKNDALGYNVWLNEVRPVSAEPLPKLTFWEKE